MEKLIPFKAYDIRGKYPEEINDEFSYSLGKTLGKNYQNVIFGIDSRIGSNIVKDYFFTGLLSEECDVTYLGIVSTPLLYYATKKHFDLGVIITASHNPKEYTGFKICDRNAIPLSPLEDIMPNFQKHQMKESPKSPCIFGEEIKEDYKSFMINKLSDVNDFRIVSDISNGASSIERDILIETFKEIEILNGESDGEFPAHPPNSIGRECLDELSKSVKKNKSDLGIIFDGDGDRLGVVDECGNEVRGDLLTAIISKEILKNNRGSKILFDLRSSNIVPEIIMESGGIPVKTRVGHPFIKKIMRDEDVIFSGEFSNHYYFREIGGFESPLLALYYILKYLKKKKLSEEISKLKKYCHSGEINLKVENPKVRIEDLLRHYSKNKIEMIDGVTVFGDSWWFNIRLSNTESLVRINAEAENENTLSELICEVKKFITGGT